MRTPRTLLFVLLIVTAIPLAAWPQPSPEEIEANGRVVAKWRTDAEHYARLKAELKAFRALPADRQQRMRTLDQELAQEEEAHRTELWQVMDRYVTWLEQLPPAERQKIESAPDATQRLQLIREQREKEWRARLPLAKQNVLRAAAEADRPALIAKWKEEEHDRHRRWDAALANPLEEKKPQRAGQPIRLNEFPVDVQTYTVYVLLPALKEDEKQELDAAEGKPWPEYARKLLTLAEKHPTVLPGSPAGPTQPRDLPNPLKKALNQAQPQMTLAEREKIRMSLGKWPEYGITVTEILRKYGGLQRELGPSKPREFGLLTGTFIEARLMPTLDDASRKKLREAEGKWPDYPQMLLELSTKAKMPLPGMRLPGPKEFWDKVRAGG